MSKIKQQITISGVNWNDIVMLPCFQKLTHYGDKWTVTVKADYNANYEDMWYGITATIGDKLVEHGNGQWEVKFADRKGIV